VNKVILSKTAQKQLKKIPTHIRNNFHIWAGQVEMLTIQEIRKISGYHDEPLFGSKKGQRSIRLSRAYRAFYIEKEDKITIKVIEVNKHEY